MRSSIPRLLAATALISFSPFSGLAQIDDGSAWKGELRAETQKIFDGYTIEVQDRYHQRVALASVRSDGAFDFRGTPKGDYRLLVFDGRGRVVQEQSIVVPMQGEAIIRLPESAASAPPAGAVSAAQLLHPPSHKAVKHFLAAQNYSHAGDYAKAAAELEQAIAISPDYADAHLNLGAQYLRLHRNQEALAEFDRSLRIAPPTPTALTDLAFAHLQLGQINDAIASARQALRLDRDHTAAHYVLGMALATSRATAPEAIVHLERAAGSMPTARENLARVRARFALTSDPAETSTQVQ